MLGSRCGAGGCVDGITVLDADLLAEATTQQSEGWCPVLERDARFGLGFQPTRSDRSFGPNQGSFGHYGTDDGSMTLIIGDTSAVYFSYPYDPTTGTVGARSVFGDTSGLEGMPDDSTLDTDGGLWCALVGGAQLALFTSSGLDRTLLLPVTNPTDVTFGGPSLGWLYVVSIGSDANNLDGALPVIDGLDTHGRAEPRCTLDLPLV